VLRWSTAQPGSPPSPPAWPSPPHSPPQIPPPQQRPVECGGARPGDCSEAAGLRDLDELHEVRARNSSNHVHICTVCACSPRPHVCVEVRCCSDGPIYEGMPPPRSGCSAWGISSWSCARDKTFAEAEAICRAQGARLCTASELVDGCTAGTGCGFDVELVWGV